MSLIVIVDDRVTNRNIFSRLAASIEPDVAVKAFGDPSEALIWLRSNSPDLVITDFKMPQMNGAEFIRQFRTIPSASEIPAIVITVYEERSFRLEALEAGATDFLNSPVDHHEFVTRARNLLKLHKHQVLLASRAVTLERKLEVSERSRERELRDSRERLAQVIDTVPVMISAAGPNGRLQFVNAYQTDFSALRQDNLIGKSSALLFGEEHGARSHALDRMVFETGKALPSFEEELTDAKGLKRVFFTTKSPLRDVTNTVTGVLTSSLDITSRKEVEAHLRHIAHHDSLTNLPNRALLRERLRTLIAHNRRGDNHFALHMIDLDGFKSVNDLIGHTEGDRFIKMIGERIRRTIRTEDTVARLGGDEFAVLQTDVTEPAQARELAMRLLSVIAEDAGIDDLPIAPTASIGIALHPTDGTDSEELLKNADLAMYRAKADNGNAVCFFAADMKARARQQALLDTALREAIAQEQFVLYFQPQIALATGEIVGAEALIRWNRPDVGTVSPGLFLPRAEENGMIVPINEWVLREACTEAKNWQKLGLPPVRVGVNLSPVQFRKRTVPLLVAQILSETGLDPRRLDLELTESIVLDDFEAVANDLQQLLELGVHVSIDDFGTGYSSLNYVRRFPVDRLKIDQSFIRNVGNANEAAIVRAIITLARSLDLEIVAEGVETADQVAFLRAEGCDEVQGYYFARPMPARDFVELLRREPALAKSA